MPGTVQEALRVRGVTVNTGKCSGSPCVLTWSVSGVCHPFTALPIVVLGLHWATCIVPFVWWCLTIVLGGGPVVGQFSRPFAGLCLAVLVVGRLFCSLILVFTYVRRRGVCCPWAYVFALWQNYFAHWTCFSSLFFCSQSDTGGGCLVVWVVGLCYLQLHFLGSCSTVFWLCLMTYKLFEKPLCPPEVFMIFFVLVMFNYYTPAPLQTHSHSSFYTVNA